MQRLGLNPPTDIGPQKFGIPLTLGLVTMMTMHCSILMQKIPTGPQKFGIPLTLGLVTMMTMHCSILMQKIPTTTHPYLRSSSSLHQD